MATNNKIKIFATIKKGISLGNKCDKYWQMMKKIEGVEVEIETDFLFLNQLNTVPIEGVSELGLRISFVDVESIRFGEGTTWECIKQNLIERYKKDWNQTLVESNFSAWYSVLKMTEAQNKAYKERGYDICGKVV